MLETRRYTTDELLKVLNISSSTWKRRREEFLEYFKYYFDYDIVPDGRAVYYDITEVYAEYQPMPRKTQHDDKVAFYREETHKIVDYQPWNTGSNIARRILDRNNKYVHAEGTAANYVRPILREDYQVSEEKQWMQNDFNHFEYVPITEEQSEFLKKLFKDFRCNNSDIIAEYKSGYIDKDVAMRSTFENEIHSYEQVMKAFIDKYGFRPMKVARFELKPF